MISFTETTQDITITVHPMYLDGQSDVMMHKFVFAYFVRIENNGSDNVKLMRRHWYIHDGTDQVKEVEGAGVVGKQPVIRPGRAHDYNSFCILETFEGYMEGTYLMRRPNREEFEARIPRFALRAAAN
jgi:ApaG protein